MLKDGEADRAFPLWHSAWWCLWENRLAVKSRRRECCLSSIRHITANVAIKVGRTHALTKTHGFRAREGGRQHTLLLGRHLAGVICWRSHWGREEEEVGDGQRGERDPSLVQDQSFAAWKSSSATSRLPHNFVKCHCSLESLWFVLFSSDFPAVPLS